MNRPPSFAEFLSTLKGQVSTPFGAPAQYGWGPVVNTAVRDAVGPPSVIDYPVGGGPVANTANIPPGYRMYEDYSIGPAAPPPVPSTLQGFSSRTPAPSAGTDLTSRLFSLPPGTSDLPSDFMEASGWGWQVPDGQGVCPAGYYRDPYGNCVAR